MKSIREEFLRLDDLPGIKRVCGIQHQIFLNITFHPEIN